MAKDTTPNIKNIDDQKLLQGLKMDIIKLAFDDNFKKTLSEFLLLKKQWNKNDECS